nr:MAG TPA: GIY-YIG nuclease superfamily protein [Caudoviricetes sp.]
MPREVVLSYFICLELNHLVYIGKYTNFKQRRTPITILICYI